MALFTSPAFDRRMITSHFTFSANISKVCGISSFSASCMGLWRSGTRSSRPS